MKKQTLFLLAAGVVIYLAYRSRSAVVPATEQTAPAPSEPSYIDESGSSDGQSQMFDQFKVPPGYRLIQTESSYVDQNGFTLTKPTLFDRPDDPDHVYMWNIRGTDLVKMPR